MSLKLEIETWVSALARYDNNEFDDAIGEFDKIAETSKILFNMGVIHATLGEHEKAVECYQRAIRLDQYLAVAYFQQGVSNFLLGDFEEALANFNDTLLYLRGNTMIDYAQLGLMFKLYSCEVLFNRGLCYIYLQQKEAGLQDLEYAVKEKVVEDHDVIDEAIREEAEGYTVFSIPVGVVYRPNEAKVRNLKAKDYLGKARLVAASDRSNTFTGFTGAEMKQASMEIKDDRPADNISFAATNLVKRDIQSRRQQSEPPASRNVFPPTPPPESDRNSTVSAGMSRGASVRNGTRPMPARLNIDSQQGGSRRYEKSTTSSPDDNRAPPRLQRSASAAPSRGFSTREPPQRRPTRTQRDREYDDDDYNNDEYNPYASSRSSQSSKVSRQPTRRQREPEPYISEEEDDASDYDNNSINDDDFDMVVPRKAASKVSRSASRRPPEVRKFRVKVHADDVRYIMIGGAVEFPDFVDRIRDKFGIRRRFKIKVKDDDAPDEMITMADQDDLDMAIESSKDAARRQRQDVGKMEIWVQEV